jgi:hypothetical protein
VTTGTSEEKDKTKMDAIEFFKKVLLTRHAENDTICVSVYTRMSDGKYRPVETFCLGVQAAAEHVAANYEREDVGAIWSNIQRLKPGSTARSKDNTERYTNLVIDIDRRWKKIHADGSVCQHVATKDNPLTCNPQRCNATDEERAVLQSTAGEIIRFIAPLARTALGRGTAGFADSGNGYHISIPMDMEPAEGQRFYNAVLNLLKQKFEKPDLNVEIDDTLSDFTQVVTIWGSHNRKYPHTELRPQRQSRFLIKPSNGLLPIKNHDLEIFLFDNKMELPADEARPVKSKYPKANAEWLAEYGVPDLVDFWEQAGISYEENEYEANDGTHHPIKPCPCHADEDLHEHSNARDCEIIVRKDGGIGISCFSKGDDGLTLGQVIAKLNEMKGESYPHQVFEEEELNLPEGLVEEEPVLAIPGPQKEGASSSAPSSSLKQNVHDAVNDLRRQPSKELPAWEKNQKITNLVYTAIRQTGKMFNVGNIAVILDHETRKLTEVVKNGPEFTNLIMDYGIYTSDDKLADSVGKMLAAKASALPKKEMYAGSYYDTRKHILYVNEWGGNILRIDGEGHITRIRNGDDNLLWNDGKNANAEPLHADIEKSYTTAIGLPGDSLIKQHILDVINYDETLGVTKDQAQLALMTALVGLFFIERIPQYPMVYFFGPGGSMKTSLATKVGKLMIGPAFQPTPGEIEADDLKNLAINNSFLLLDEANKLRALQNILKAIVTGSSDKRRELYTTATQRESKYVSRIWMTANTVDIANETVSSRMLIFDAGKRTEENPYRSTFHINREWDNGGLRNVIWTELVGRLAQAMRSLTRMDEQGSDYRVSHRMSDLFVFGMTLAKAENMEQRMKEAMDALEARSKSGTAQTLDIVTLIQSLPRSYNVGTDAAGKAKGMRPANEWAKILPGVVPDVNRELKQKAASTWWVAGQFQRNEHTLVETVGMVKSSMLDKSKNKTFVYGFTGCAGDEPTMPDHPNFTPETKMSSDESAPDFRPFDDDFTGPSAKQAKAAKKGDGNGNSVTGRCMCQGCKYCDPKTHGTKAAPCWRTRRTDHSKCSACRNAIPADLADGPVTESANNATKAPKSNGKMQEFDLSELDDL